MRTDLDLQMGGAELFTGLTDFLKSKGHAFEADEEEQVVMLRVAGESGCYSAWIRCEDGPPLLQILIDHPVGVPAERIVAMSCFIHEINSSLPMGQFGLDGAEHRVRYRLAFPIQVGAPLEDQFIQALRATFQTFESRLHLIAALASTTGEVEQECRKLKQVAWIKIATGLTSLMLSATASPERVCSQRAAE